MDQASVLGLIHREAVGVVATIVPWNFPLMIGAWKLAPALAMGNSVVLKPAETASLTLLRLAELALEAGAPPGVLNVVTGPGRVTGEALDLATAIGAVNSELQLAANLGFVADARAEGGTIILGGTRARTETGGFYMDPTIVTGVAPAHRLFRDEVFGPVLAVTPFNTEAARLANATDFGLAAGVWTANLGRANRMIRAIRAGVVHVNTYGGADATVPLGGMKQSGNGHDKSLHALDKYTDLKTAWIQL